MTKRAAVLTAVTCAILAPAPIVVSAQQPNSEAARIGDRVVTLQEVDDAWRKADAEKFAEARQELYDGRRQTIDRMVAGALIEQAAAARKMTVDALLADEIGKRRKPITPADIEAFYNANKSQMQGQPLEKMQDPVRQFLNNQQEVAARNAFVAELKKAGPPIRVTLEPPRMPVQETATDPVRGSASAPITIVEFSDFQCPFCARVEPTLAKVRQTYGDRVRLVWKDFPLDIHPQAAKAAEAAHCAAEQGKYWELHDRLFSNQSTLQPDALKQHAAAVGVNADAFNTCLDSGRYAARVNQGIAEGQTLGVNSTPTLYINGRPVIGAQPYDAIAGVIDDELARAKK